MPTDLHKVNKFSEAFPFNKISSAIFFIINESSDCEKPEKQAKAENRIADIVLLIIYRVLNKLTDKNPIHEWKLM